jgi:hypothetical protein
MTTIAPATAPASGYTPSPRTTTAEVAPTDPMAGVARAMGLSRQQLADRLSSGKNLTEIAQAQGVHNNQLLAAIQTGAPTITKKAESDAIAPIGSVGSMGSLSGSWQYARESGGAVTGMLITAGGTASSPRLQQLSSFLGADPAALRARFAGGDTLLGMQSVRNSDPLPISTTPTTSLPQTAAAGPELTGPETGSVSTVSVRSTALANTVAPSSVPVGADYSSAAASTTAFRDQGDSSTIDLRSVLRPGDLFDVRV